MDGMNIAGAHTRDRLLDAAELLLDKQGLESASTRAIASYAATNSAAPNFHFGSKSNLITEMFRRRMKPLIKERIQQLESSKEITVAAIVDSFVDPLVELARSCDENKLAFLRLLAKNTVSPCSQFTNLLDTEHQDYTQRYEEALRQALPDLSSEERTTRFDLAIGAIARAHSHHNGLQSEKRVKRLKAFVIAGLTAQ